MGKDDPETVANKIIAEEYRLWSGPVQKVNEKGKVEKKPTFLVISAYNVGFLNPKKAKLDPEFPWTRLESYSFKDTEMRLTFRDPNPGKKKTPLEIRFQAETAGEVHAILYQFLSETLSQGEFDALNLKEYGKAVVTPLPQRVFNRAVIPLGGSQLKHRPGNHVKRLIETLSPRCVFEAEDIGDKLDIVMYVMRAFWGQSLQLPNVNGTWEKLQKSLPLNYAFVESGEELNADFTQFLEAAKEKRGLLAGIGFKGQTISDDQLEQIVTLADALKLSTLSFNGCGMNSGALVSSVQAKLSYSLQMLVLDSVTDLRIDEILPKVSFLRALSLVNCGIEIPDLLQRLQDYNYVNLSMLNVSQNSFAAEFVVNDGWNLPRLQRLHMDGVRWQNGRMSEFVQKLFRQRFDYGLKLNLSRAQLSPADADSVIAALKSANTSQLVEFWWNENPVNQDFVDFVARSVNLWALGVRGCFGDDPSLLQAFGVAVAGLTQLQELIMTGTDVKKTGSSIAMFLDALQTSQSLCRLDISHQNIGLPGYHAIETLLDQNGTIKQIAADGSGVDDVSCFERVVRKLPMGKLLAFPVTDMSRLLESGAIDEARFNEIKTLFSNVFAGRPVDATVAPFGYFALTSMFEEFPIVVTPNLSETFDVNVQWMPMEGRGDWTGSGSEDASPGDNFSEGGRHANGHSESRSMKSSSKRKLKDDSDSGEEERGRNKRSSSKRKLKDDSDSDEEEKGRSKRSSSKRKRQDDSDSDEESRGRNKRSSQSKRKLKDDYDSDEEEKGRNKRSSFSKRKLRDDSDSDEEEKGRNKRSSFSKRKPRDDSDSDEEERGRNKRSSFSKRKPKDDYSDEYTVKKTKAVSRRGRDSSASSDDEDIYYKPAKSSKKVSGKSSRYADPVPDPKRSSARQAFQGRPRPKRDQYEVPNWEFPEALSKKFDAKPAFHRLQQEFALSVLRDSI